MTNKQKTIFAAVTLLIVVALSCYIFLDKGYTIKFDVFENDFSWNMTMEDAENYIKENSVQTWREIEITEDSVSDGFYTFWFKDGKLYRADINMGEDRTVVDTVNKWFDEKLYRHKESKYSYIGYYYWYGMMDNKKTEALLFAVDDTIYLSFTLEEKI